MSMDKHIVHIPKENYLGKGVHRAAYIDPEDNRKVIKILFDPNDAECHRELVYRKTRESRKLTSSLLTEYYGTCETDMGLGYIFERVVNDDGSIPVDLDVYLKAQEDADTVNYVRVQNLLIEFGKRFLQEKIVVSNLHGNNLAVQCFADGHEQIRIIDNIGSPAKLPLAYYFDFIALRRDKRYWNRFVQDLAKKYPRVINKDMQLALENLSKTI